MSESSPYYDLGPHRRPVTTTSPDAQQWFDRGLVWAYAFNHEESVRCFTRATEFDPSCAMAFWGIAYAVGPNYNKAWAFFDRGDLESSVQKATAALSRAAQLAAQCTPIEKSLINALPARFPAPDQIPADMAPYNHAYADAMRVVYRAHSADIDVAAIFGEALMCISPRGLWDLDTGKPSGEHTVEAQTVIESAMARTADNGHNHPALCHLYIHLMEMSPVPERALPAADRLRSLVPDASHMLHMPTHIDMAVGDYRRAVDSNRASMLADDQYFRRENRGSALYIAYRVHNICALLYAALISGRSQDALAAADRLSTVIDGPVLATTSPPLADWTESFLGNRAHVLIRFGRWADILALPLPTDRTTYSATTATTLYAKAIALSALNRIPEAEATQRDFETARAAVPASRFNSIPCKEVDVLRVAAAMLTGELAYRRGDFDTAFASLREAISLEDNLPYSDPPPWMQPVRHALGALLLEQNRVADAERVFREDLGVALGFPRRKARLNNVWGLHGLHECLVRAGKKEEAAAVRVPLDIALASADVVVEKSCYCRVSGCSPAAGCVASL
ncbi:TPR-like protein [Aspergillus campestris IBT 28561]|uniref:TPR-like protein n=1 Tax=Aspergillus campestris (strain IBT 28561) TaxID=1392248 RepID=A0A2I1D2I0_ASPC2|nr:TPR-like protein [Aspergillus campestris IBT 28561]PKY04067.1 TPR-like protein [Aspergillus campestris IBT 28561]